MSTVATPGRRAAALATVEAPVDRRAEIIHAAATVVGREGVAATSVKEIAAEAGVAPGLVHYYFASKEELIVAVAAALCEEVQTQWLNAVAGVDDPFQRIEAAFRHVGRVLRERPAVYRLVFDLQVAGFGKPAIRSQMRLLWERYVDLVELEVRRGYAFLALDPPVPPRDLAQGIAAAIDGVALMSLANGHDPEPDYRALRAMVASLLVVAHIDAGRPVPFDRLRPLLGGLPATGGEAR